MNSKLDPQDKVWILKVISRTSSYFVPGCDSSKNFYRLSANIYPGIRHEVLTYAPAPIPISTFTNNINNNPVITLNKQLVDDIAACVISHGHIGEDNEQFLW